MSTSDPDRARSRFITAVRRIRAGLELERERILRTAKEAPRLLEGTRYEVTNLTGLPDNDLDYYAYELARLQDTARAVIRAFDEPSEVASALEEFEAAIPELRAARNPLTHPSDDDRLDDVGWFSALVKMLPTGRVEYLVDPRYGHHDAALKLADSLLGFLRKGLRE